MRVKRKEFRRRYKALMFYLMEHLDEIVGWAIPDLDPLEDEIYAEEVLWDLMMDDVIRWVDERVPRVTRWEFEQVNAFLENWYKTAERPEFPRPSIEAVLMKPGRKLASGEIWSADLGAFSTHSMLYLEPPWEDPMINDHFVEDFERWRRTQPVQPPRWGIVTDTQVTLIDLEPQGADYQRVILHHRAFEMNREALEGNPRHILLTDYGPDAEFFAQQGMDVALVENGRHTFRHGNKP